MLDVLGCTYAVALLDILLGWCSGLCFGHTHQSPPGALFAGAPICRVRSWMSAWVFLLLGGMDSIVFGPIRWCVWSFRLSSPLRLPHLKYLFVCFAVPAGGLFLLAPSLAHSEQSHSKLTPSVLMIPNHLDPAHRPTPAKVTAEVEPMS